MAEHVDGCGRRTHASLRGSVYAPRPACVPVVVVGDLGWVGAGSCLPAGAGACRNAGFVQRSISPIPVETAISRAARVKHAAERHPRRITRGVLLSSATTERAGQKDKYRS